MRHRQTARPAIIYAMTLPDPAILLDCLALCEACYSDAPEDAGIVVRTPGLDDLCIIQPHHDRIDVCLAGTRNIPQWLSNLKGAGSMARNADDSRTHEGIHEAYHLFALPMWDALRKAGAMQDGIPVRVFGHSRGGGLAFEFVRRHGAHCNIVALVTLGSLRPADKYACKIVESRVCGPIYRITNNNDPVPWVPPWSRGFRHVGSHYHFDRRGTLRPGGMGFVSGLWDGIAGRAGAAWNRVVLDGVEDHRLPRGYGPAIRAYAAAQSA